MITTCGSGTLCGTSHLKVFVYTSHYLSLCYQCIFVLAFMNLHMSWNIKKIMPQSHLFSSYNCSFMSLQFSYLLHSLASSIKARSSHILFLSYHFLLLIVHAFCFTGCTNNVFHIDVLNNIFFSHFKNFNYPCFLFIAIELISICWRSCFSMCNCKI
jgi:hypothetical protein